MFVLKFKVVVTSITAIKWCVGDLNLISNAGIWFCLSATGLHPQQQRCCYGDGIVMDGEVAHSVADCCLQLVCEGGKLVERRAGHPGSTNCKHQPLAFVSY